MNCTAPVASHRFGDCWRSTGVKAENTASASRSPLSSSPTLRLMANRSPNPRSRAQAQTLFGLSDSAMQALQTEVRGAGRFLVWHQTKVGFITQILHKPP